jgi:hypothetical protein
MISDQKIKEIIKEATSTSGSRGSYVGPLQIGIRLFEKDKLGPFTIPVSDYDSPELEYDSYDGKMDTPKKKIKSLEKKAKKISNYMKNHTELTSSDEDGNTINPFPSKLNEDLAVWFGTKKKPKGSNQPKGPWVNICRKKEGGGHPPCGRSDTDKGAYPKCRAAGVASKMTDSQKRSACQQKRNAEKKDTQTGKGQKPVMTSYKTKKESIDSLVDKILTEIRNSF